MVQYDCWLENNRVQYCTAWYIYYYESCLAQIHHFKIARLYDILFRSRPRGVIDASFTGNKFAVIVLSTKQEGAFEKKWRMCFFECFWSRSINTFFTIVSCASDLCLSLFYLGKCLSLAQLQAIIQPTPTYFQFHRRENWQITILI